MDALSEALTSVRMTSAIFITQSAPPHGGSGCRRSRRWPTFLPLGPERLVSYHLLTEGKAVAEFADATVSLTPATC